VNTSRRPAQELRATIDRLPLDVRRAVLDGMQSQRIIAGAHADGLGGLCPMEAAEVSWKSVSAASMEVAQEAARAWDRYAEARGAWRPATKRQLLALQSMLEASILEETAQTEVSLSEVIAEHERSKALRAATPAREATPASPPTLAPAVTAPAGFTRPPADAPVAPAVPAPSAADASTPPVVSSRRRRETGERDRSGELRERDGWAWLKPFRNYDQYEEALVRALSELDRHEAELDEQLARP